MGGRRVGLQQLHPGVVFGDVPFLCRKPVAFAVEALRPTQVAHLDVELFWTLVTTRPDISQRFLRSMAGRVDHLQSRDVQLNADDLRRRLAA